MKHHEYVLQNIDLLFNTDTDILDLFFVAQNTSTDTRVRYLDFKDLRPLHIRPNYWQYNTDTDLPLLTYYIEDYYDGQFGGCRKNLTVFFRITIRSQIHDTPIAPELVDITNPLSFASELFSKIKCRFQNKPNLFETNECKDVEEIDCNGVTTITSFKYNVRGDVRAPILNRELTVNDKEVIQYEMGIPISIYKLFKNCPCSEIDEDC